MVHFESGIERKKRGFGKENILSSHISDFQIPRGIQWSEVQRSEIRFSGDSKSFVRPNFVTDKKKLFYDFYIYYKRRRGNNLGTLSNQASEWYLVLLSLLI